MVPGSNPGGPTKPVLPILPPLLRREPPSLMFSILACALGVRVLEEGVALRASLFMAPRRGSVFKAPLIPRLVDAG